MDQKDPCYVQFPAATPNTEQIHLAFTVTLQKKNTAKKSLYFQYGVLGTLNVCVRACSLTPTRWVFLYIYTHTFHIQTSKQTSTLKLLGALVFP